LKLTVGFLQFYVFVEKSAVELLVFILQSVDLLLQFLIFIPQIINLILDTIRPLYFITVSLVQLLIFFLTQHWHTLSSL